MTPQEIKQDIQRYIWYIEHRFGGLDLTEVQKQDKLFPEWLEKKSGKRKVIGNFR